MRECITVGALNHYVRMLLKSDEVLSQVWVEGEIVDFSIHSKTGHAFFSLRDSESASTVRAVMFADCACRLRFMPKNGMYVIAPCQVTLYENSGTFQVNVTDLRPQGLGSVAQQFDLKKRRLEDEGLFAESRKRPLPISPSRIAVITSKDASVLQDIISVSRRRNPMLHLKIFDVSVQGPRAVSSMMKAIQMVNEDDWAELVIFARGGGGKEDLWVFDDEELARASAQLRVPFISAIGHETNITLLDGVSDMRAETPSAALEIALRRDLSAEWEDIKRTYHAMSDRLARRIADLKQEVLIEKEHLMRSADRYLSRRFARWHTEDRVIRTLNPMNVLFRGYSRVTKDTVLVNSVAQLNLHDAICVHFFDGTADCVVEYCNKETADVPKNF